MDWRDPPAFERRPLVFVEDHLYHSGELLGALARRDQTLLRDVTICAIDREGPDTEAAVAEWLARHPTVQIAAAAAAPADRLRAIRPGDLATAPAFARLVAGLLRPGGVLVQDVQLSTLPFVPADRWWETIYVAATVRGLFADRPPVVRFCSNKRSYSATFGRDLVDAGFDPRDVLDKSELASVGVPALVSLFDRQCPLVLETAAGRDMTTRRVGAADRADIERDLDLVLWPSPQGLDLGGRLVAGPERRVLVKAASHEAATWTALVADRLAWGEGVPVIEIGERVGPPAAERAELTNVAARHAHTLRSRLSDAAAIVTANHAYRLADGLRVGRVQRSGHQI